MSAVCKVQKFKKGFIKVTAKVKRPSEVKETQSPNTKKTKKVQCLLGHQERIIKRGVRKSV